MLLIAILFAGIADAQLISTIAGTGTAGYNGDGILATSAQLREPQGVTIDAAGNIYISDQVNHRVRKIDISTGIISTIAGTGTAGYNGDGIAATSANLYGPVEITLDATENIYIGDFSNHRIRKVDMSTGIISTVAGTGTGGYNGDGIIATTAQLNLPAGIAFDATGNVYIGDYGNHRVRKIDISTGLISTIAGTGTAGYNGDAITATTAQLNLPAGVIFDGAGNMYIGDAKNQRVRKVDAGTGFISTIAGTGTIGYNGDGIAATSAQLNYPFYIVFDAGGNLYIGDYYNHRVRKVTGVVLPIELLSFTGIYENNENTLTWVTARETSNDYFTVESSMDGIIFGAIGTLKGSGNSSSTRRYNFTDPNYPSGNKYYRLKQTDHDGKFSYSKIISLVEPDRQSRISIYPNPAKDQLTVEIYSETKNVLVEIYNTQAEKIYSEEIITASGCFSKEINLNVPAGIYFVKVVDGEQQYTKKLLVQHN